MEHTPTDQRPQECEHYVENKLGLDGVITKIIAHHSVITVEFHKIAPTSFLKQKKYESGIKAN